MPLCPYAPAPMFHVRSSPSRSPTGFPDFVAKDPQFRQQKYLVGQDQVLAEAATRIRSGSEPRLSQNEKIPGQLIVLLAKFDSCQSLCKRKKLLSEPVVRKLPDGSSVLHLDALHETSAEIRRLLAEYAGEIINEAESSFEEVIYIPVSAFGRPPEQVDETMFGIRPRDVHAQWTEVPLLYALHKSAPRLMPVARHTLSIVAPPQFFHARICSTSFPRRERSPCIAGYGGEATLVGAAFRTCGLGPYVRLRR